MPKYSKLFGDIYDFVLFLPDRIFLRARRKRLLSNISGKVLEIGFGTGSNFEHYNYNVELIGIEPSPYMFSRGLKKYRRSPNFGNYKLYNIGCGNPELGGIVTEETLDAIVCTLVLCTLPNPEESISNFKKWLKPNGKLIILEHIKSHGKHSAKIQDFINPAWQKISEGCQLNRQTDVLLLQAGFKTISKQYFWLGMPFYEAVLEK